jgi:GNAT superfamily N-acetyltransferase
MTSTDPIAPLPTWSLVAEDPPTVDGCRALTTFMLDESEDRKSIPPEKALIAAWKLRENPYGSGFASLMMTEESRRRIVSTCTVTPKRLWMGGREQKWAEIGDTFTNPSFQRKGMFAALVNASRSRGQAAGFEIIYGLPNENSRPGYVNKLNFAVDEHVAFVNHVVVVTPRGAARQAARVHPWAETLLRHPSVGSVKYAVRGLLRAVRSRHFEIEAVSTCGPEFDDLWERARAELAVAQVRDARHLTWRYLDNPFPYRLLAARRGGQLVGYVAVLVTPPHADGLRRGYLMDWLFVASEAASVGRALLVAGLREAAKGGADLVFGESTANSPLPLPWPKVGVVRRPGSKPIIIHRNEAGQALLDDATPWHFTLGDSDAF